MTNNNNFIQLKLKIDGKEQIIECGYSIIAEKDSNKYTFKIEGDTWKAYEMKAYIASKNKYNVVGFRKGKAPKHIIENNYGKGTFVEETIDILINECYRPLFEEVLSKLDLAARPEVEVINAGEDFVEFAYVVTTMPEINIDNYKGLTVEKVVPDEIDEEKINKEIDAARDKVGYWDEVTDRAVEEKDTVTIDFSGSLDGERFEGGTAEKQDLVIGSNTFIPGFEEQLVGMKVGEEKDIRVRFPKDYGAENLADKEVVFAIKLHTIKSKTLPALDDEFAKDVSEYDTLIEYKASIEKKLKEEAEKSAKYATEGKMIDALIEANPFDLPEKYIENLIDQKIAEFDNMLKGQGLDLAKYFEYTGTKEEDMRKHYREESVKKDKIRMVLTQIIEKEKLTLTPEEVDAEILKGAEKLGKTLEEYKKEMQASEYDYIANSIMSDRIMEYLFDNNTLV